MKIKVSSSVLLILTLFVMSGCGGGRRLEVAVNGFQNSKVAMPSHATYVVQPASARETDLEFQEYAQLVEKQLDTRGLQKGESKSADIKVYIGYGIDDGTAHNFAYSSPVYGQTGGGTSTFSGTSFSNKGTTTFSSGTVQTQPTYGVVGSASHGGSYSVYKRVLVIEAIDAQKSQSDSAVTPIWKGEAISKGSSDDLRRIMPSLIEAAFKHFGEDTKKAIRHVFYEDSEGNWKLKSNQ